MYRLLCVWALAVTVACPGESQPETEPLPPMPPLTAGSAQAGVYADFLRLPAGIPLGGYTSRDAAFGGTRTRPRDLRKSPWAHKFHPSAGHLTGVPLQALWLSNGDRHLVLLKVDLIGSFDGLVGRLERGLSQSTGIDMTGSVVMATSHSHSAPAAYFQSLQFALGFDRYDPRVLDRITEQAHDAALSAFRRLQPAKLGFGIVPDFDPVDDNLIYRDRRQENDHLLSPKGQPALKDPSARLLKVETTTGQLMAVALHVGLHGTLFNDDNAWIHWDAPGAVAWGLSAALEGVPVLHFQAGGGDISPGGQGDGPMLRSDDIARISGQRLAPIVRSLTTSAGPFILDSSTATVVQQHQEVRVRRQGSSDFHYTPVTLDEYGDAVEDPDNLVYGPDGSVLEAIDEFQAPIGAGLCGDAQGIPFGTIGMGIGKADPEGPYIGCAVLDRLIPVIAGRYQIDQDQFLYAGSTAKPTNNERAMGFSTVAFARFDGLPITEMNRRGERQEQVGDVGMIFLPGETTTLLNWVGDHQLEALGFDLPWVVGYAQDHEGYLLTVEDWLSGGYEPSINIWGPLQGEYLMEQALELAARGRGDRRVDHRGIDVGRPDYASEPLGFDPLSETRHVTPRAGTWVESLPERGILMPLNLDIGDLDPTERVNTLRRYQDVYLAVFEGGDVAIDSPRVYLEIQGEDGQFVPFKSGSRVIDSDGPSVLMGYNPDPSRPSSASDERRHLWVFAWQPVGEGTDPLDWLNVPIGTYRFVVTGQALVSSPVEAPAPYQLLGEPFQMEPATIDVTVVTGGLRLAYAGAPLGFRKRGEGRTATGSVSLPPGISVTVDCQGGEQVLNVEAEGFLALETLADCEYVTDEAGNIGQIR
ncbi:MAG: hypothetical protein VX405_09340 [Myxococcota bacterium]|nr:hypothetical protein [Myxococcota bacterium]